MIVLITDFTLAGPYTGQMKAVLSRLSPDTPVIDLFSDLPPFDPELSAYLIRAYVEEFPPGTVFLCVVDPGVGGDRTPGVLKAGGRWFVGPDNGLFELILRRDLENARWWEIAYRPERLSATFHGRDLFAPVAAGLAKGGAPEGEERPIETVRRAHWPDDLKKVVYRDGFGNAMTGIRACVMPGDAELVVAGKPLTRARTFSDRARGEAFWFENANGLVEIAVNCGRADDVLGIALGMEVAVRPDIQ